MVNDERNPETGDNMPVETEEETKERLKKKAGKTIKLDINDEVAQTDNVNLGKPSKERIEQVAQSMVLFLLDMRKTLASARDIVEKIGFQHLALNLDNCVKDISIYLEQYENDKAKEKDKNAKS